MKLAESKPGFYIKSYAKLGNIIQQLSLVSGVTASCKVLAAGSSFYPK